MTAGNEREGHRRGRGAEASGKGGAGADGTGGRRDTDGTHTNGVEPRTEGAYPGERLGLPEDGPGALGGWGRRLVGLFVDWLIANLIVWLVIRTPEAWQAPATGIDFLPLIVFGLEVWLLTAFLGAGVGHRVSGLAVIGPDGRLPGVGRAAARTVLILLVVPPLVVDPDGRGLHDRLAGTLLVRTR